MDTAEEMNDYGARCGALCRTLARQAVCQQHAESRTRVGLKQEENGFSRFLYLLDSHWGENSVVDCVVQEQNLCRLDENTCHWKKFVVNEETNTCPHCLV